MKKNLSSLIFAVVVAGVVGYALFEYRSSQEEVGEKAAEGRLISQADEDLTSLNLKTKDHQFLLKKDSGQWKITEPIQDLADSANVQSYLDTLVTQKTKLAEVEGTPNWDQYGLGDGQAVQIEVTNAAGKKFLILVGEKPAFDGSFYIKWDGKLYIGQTGWARIIEKLANDLRDKRIFRSEEIPSRIEIQSGSSKLILTKESSWQLASSKAQFALDQQKIEDFLSDLRKLKATEIVADNKTDAKKLKEFKLTQPTERIRIEFASKEKKIEPVSLNLSVDNKDGFVITSAADPIYKLSLSDAEKLKKTVADFRDTKEPFRFALEKATSVHVRIGAIEVKAKKEGSTWQLTEGKPEDELDSSKLEALLTKINGLEADSFVEGPGKGLNAPKGLIEIADGDGKNLLKLIWGDEFKAKANGVPLFYVKSSLAKETLGVKTGQISALTLEGLFKKKSPSSPGNQSSNPSKPETEKAKN